MSGLLLVTLSLGLFGCAQGFDVPTATTGNDGFVDILELGGVTAYGKPVTLNEEFLPAAAVYRGLYATGN